MDGQYPALWSRKDFAPLANGILPLAFWPLLDDSAYYNYEVYEVDEDGNPKNPGDSNQPMLWFGLMGIAVVTFLVVENRKRRSNR